MSAALDPATLHRLRETGDQPIELFVINPETKICDYCDGLFHRNRRSPSTWREQRFCSISCGKRAMHVPGDARTCEVCAALFKRPPSVSRAKFETRRACGTPCAKVLSNRARQIVTEPKACPCGTLFDRTPGTSRAEWEKKRCCSRACVGRYRTRPDQGPTSKPCAQCTTGLVVRAERGRANFERRRFCSKLCSAAALRKEPKPKPVRAPKVVVVETKLCAGCPDVITRKPSGEPPSSWLRRKFCSHACSDRSRRKPTAEREPRKPAVRKPKPGALTVVIPPKPPAVPRPIWRPGLAEDGSGDLMPGFAREVQVWGAGRR